MKKTHLTETKFSDLNLAPQVVTGLEAMGFEHCTSIQALSLPVLLQGTDIAGQAQTGEGKTLVATLPVYLNALSGNGVHVVTVNDYLATPFLDEWFKQFQHLTERLENEK